MNKNAADISVIVPAYNRANLIAETLKSLLNQSLSAKEIIVVDDGSTDDTARVVERIAEEIEVRRSAQLSKVPTSRAKVTGGAAEPQRTERRVAPEDRRSKIGDWGCGGAAEDGGRRTEDG